MNRWPGIRELALLRIRTFIREPEALFWTFGFPILMAIGLGIAFGGDGAAPVPVALVNGSAAEAHREALVRSSDLDVQHLSEAEAADALRRGEVDLLIAGADSITFRFDPSRAESRTARVLVDQAIQTGAGAEPIVPIVESAERQPGSRYIDWVIPGLIGLNLLSTGMWGIGFGIVMMRQKKQLKRLIATPMHRGDFLMAQMLARLGFLILEVPPLVLFAWFAFDVRMAGSWLHLTIVVLLGTLAFSGLGLLAASRPRTIEGASGIMNVIMLPMFILSGVFFSASRFPDSIQPFIQALPLTALNDALRAVYNDGLPLTEVPLELLNLLLWTVGSAFIALRLFRWR